MNLKTKRAIKQLKQIEKIVNQSRNNGNDLRLAAEWNKKWHSLISTILSAQTKDETTIKISNKLYKEYNSLEKLAYASIRDIKRIIRPVNYYKTKARHIKETAGIIIEEYKGNIPRTREGLLKLPGVGRKVANVYLVHAHKAAAIGVDTHVAYLSRLLKWTNEKNPHRIEKDLERLFPEKYWNSINYILVRFGRLYKTRKKQEEKLRKEGITKKI